MNKQEWKKRFNELFKGCTLYCIQLDGFSHAIHYKDASGQRHHGDYSAYCSEHNDKGEYMRYTTDGKAILYSFNLDIVKKFFAGVGHLEHSHGNHKEIIFKDVRLW